MHSQHALSYSAHACSPKHTIVTIIIYIALYSCFCRQLMIRSRSNKGRTLKRPLANVKIALKSAELA